MSAFSAADHGYMARALQLAAKGLYTTTPNPRVGCVVVRDGAIVGEGWHARAGEPHAEIHALRDAGTAAQGSTVYVTLEPCAHHGKTPPCADALVHAGVARVVAAMQDPNPRVAGEGLARLAAAGIAVESGLLGDAARELNLGFLKRMLLGHPYVRLKTAASLDGKTALANGASQWITGAAARADVQRLRARACAVLTGSGTVLADNPRLDVRDFEVGRQPLRVVADSALRTPPDAHLLAGGKALIVCAEPDARKMAALEATGAKVLCLPGADGRVELNALLAHLARLGVNEVHVEAGATLAGTLLKAGLVDEWVHYAAPKALGEPARGLFAEFNLMNLTEARLFRVVDERRVGQDWRFTMRPEQAPGPATMPS